MILEIHRDPENITIGAGDSLLDAADIARDIERESLDRFVFLHHEKKDLSVRKFLTPIVLRAQIQWVFSQDGQFCLLDKESKTLIQVPAQSVGDFFLQIVYGQDPKDVINDKIDSIFCAMRHCGSKIAKTFLYEVIGERPQLWVVAHSSLSLDDLSTFKLGWV